MQILIAMWMAAVAAIQLHPLPPRIVRSDPVLVRAVIDGDTIDVATIGRVRLLGIDAPEIGRVFDTPAPFAREARERLADLVLRHWVRLEQDGPALDVYSRHLAYVVREDGLFVNAVLVEEGLARISARLPLRRLDELQRAEHDAQTFRRGMWASAPRGGPTRYTAPFAGRSAAAASKKPRASRGTKAHSRKPSAQP
jgi:endonuclease YncB( thermonuclease family)